MRRLLLALASLLVPLLALAADAPKKGAFTLTGLTVDVDITHSYRGDLVLKLAKNGAAVKTLLQNVGGSADDVKESFTLTQAEIGTDVNTQWTLQVIDTEAQDVGTVNSVTLKFAL